MKSGVSLLKNIKANYINQVYVAAVGIVVVPLYAKYLGVEAYGLIGFFSMLQSWFLLLDVGLTPTISRVCARFRAGAIEKIEFFKFNSILTLMFYSVAVIGGLLLLLSSSYISTHWLSSSKVEVQTIHFSIGVMGILIPIRWLCGLYRGVITGYERFVLLSYFNIIIATFRFLIVIPVMALTEYSLKVFFIYQLCIAALELFYLGFYVRRGLNIKLTSFNLKDFYDLKVHLKFSVVLAFTSIVWIFVTQSDKLILSGILNLKDYGYFTMATVLAGGLIVLGTPIGNAIMPRLSNLYAANKMAEFETVFVKSTKLCVYIVGSCALLLSLFAAEISLIWTRDIKTVKEIAGLISIYALANGMLAVSSFNYYLQYSVGKLKLHFWSNLFVAILIVPTIIFVASSYGVYGAAYVWLSLNVFYFFIWNPFVVRKLMPNLMVGWFLNAVVKPVAIISFIGVVLKLAVNNHVYDLLVVLING